MVDEHAFEGSDEDKPLAARHTQTLVQAPTFCKCISKTTQMKHAKVFVGVVWKNQFYMSCNTHIHTQKCVAAFEFSLEASRRGFQVSSAGQAEFLRSVSDPGAPSRHSGLFAAGT